MDQFSERLSDADALIWRIEGDPVLRSPILVVGLLDRTPSWARLHAAMERAVEEVPRLGQRLVTGPVGARPRWVHDDTFSLDHHLRRLGASTAGGLRAALDLAEPDVMTAFDPARPLWQLTLIDGLDGNNAAFVLRFHHTITDGVGGVALAQRIFEPTRRPGPSRRTGARPPHSTVPGGTGPDVGALASGVIRAALDPLGTFRTGTRTIRSVAKMLAPARAPLSPILVGRGLDRRLHVLDLPLDGLRRAAHTAGGTVNDALLAAVAGGLREYHDTCGAPVDAIRVTMPISLRTAADRPGGNRFTPARFVLPVDDPDPARRVEHAGSIVRSWRAEPAVGLTPVLAWALDRLPTPIVQRAFGGMLRSVDVDAVDVPGLGDPAYLAGARVDRMWAFAPPTGAAMSITLVSHLQTACVGIASDLAAVSDPELLAGCIRRAFDEVLDLADEGLVSDAPA